MSSLEVRHVAMTDPVVRPLLEDLVQEYASRYGSVYEDLIAYPAARFAPPDGAFLVLIENEQAIAGGAFQRYDPDTAEVKRVWTHRDHRRRGLAARIMAELEKEAAGRGYTRIYLMTGPNQPEAVNLYLANGYTALFDLASPPTSGPLPFEKALIGA
ncbi:GNAT superfamily N-acetyltransferase [Kibdelosporangium banguiense]|uniref:GNAT superfamily N-acetyltransferase n=1 Tax=Kibdelosporangium banguiense TaxID=1365924 RepID=A0ABS4T574_9PSEU|nr:GNAT family N-acetyltransferase [Kibdelosporangium banguiense]MBP2319621.1 GNAT superfamily N-acetyltransferase [Kibdelosporangium banguiense]